MKRRDGNVGGLIVLDGGGYGCYESPRKDGPISSCSHNTKKKHSLTSQNYSLWGVLLLCCRFICCAHNFNPPPKYSTASMRKRRAAPGPAADDDDAAAMTTSSDEEEEKMEDENSEEELPAVLEAMRDSVNTRN